MTNSTPEDPIRPGHSARIRPDTLHRNPWFTTTCKTPPLIHLCEITVVLLKAPLCPIIVALHIPKEHTSGLAHHLTNISGHSIIVTEAGHLPPRGVILLQGGTDYGVVASTDGFSLQRVRGGASSFHPNANILLTSMAKLNQPSVGIILTGMGDDGSEGVKAFAAQGFRFLHNDHRAVLWLACHRQPLQPALSAISRHLQKLGYASTICFYNQNQLKTYNWRL